MEAVNKTNGTVYTIRKDNSGRWYGYCPQTREYTPAFINFGRLCNFFELKGYKIYEEYVDLEEEKCAGDVDY